jgi:PAS domain S-box-containing protein
MENPTLTCSQTSNGGNDVSVLVYLPNNPDIDSILRVLQGIGVAATTAKTQQELGAEFERGAGVLMIAEEALTPEVWSWLRDSLQAQPSWSELPIILLLRQGPETEGALDALQLQGDVTVVERPVRVNTLVAVVRSAVRSRRRQFLLRDQLQALELSEDRYRTLFESIDEGFCVVEVIYDENGKAIDYLFLEINPAFQRHTGLLHAQGKTARQMVPNLEEYWFEIYGRIALTGKAERFEERADALHAWYDVYAFRIGHPEERQVAILFKDIAQRKLAEAEIEKLNAALAARAEELESANSSLKTFNYAIAHDLKNPLNLIGGYWQMLEQLCSDKLSEECREFLRKGQEKVAGMNRLITALLDFARMVRIEPRLENLNLSEMALKTASELRQAEPQRRISFQIAADLTTKGDPSLMQVVLDNLIGNAWKYTGMVDDGVIELGAIEVDGETVYFVRDNGRGFEMADAEKIFTPFQRLPGADKYQGHGIGLATVERIIHHHGGRVWAEGEPGKGATFYFTLGTRSTDAS